MESQIIKAIEVAWSPQSPQNLKSQAFDFLNQVRSDPQGWSVCLSIAIRQPKASDVIRHVCLEVVNTTVVGNGVDAQCLIYIRDRLLEYLRDAYGTERGSMEHDSNAIQNKIVQTLTYLFLKTYVSEWPTFFDDLLRLTTTGNSGTRDNAPGILVYLKTLVSIHDEIADTLVPRSSEVQQRDNNLKDLVRERDVHKIAQSWHEILPRWKLDNTAISISCLAAIGRWANWIDLSLIVNETFLNILFQFVTSATSRQEERTRVLLEPSINALTEVLAKKMKGSDKIELIEVLRVEQFVAQITNCQALQNSRFTPNYDTDLAEVVAKLVNNTVFEVILVLENADYTDPVSSRADNQLQAFLPYVLRFFSDEYDEICSSVIPCLTDILTFFRNHRKKNQGNTKYSAMLPPILQGIIAKMKYDETSSWGVEDAQTDEAEFQELRKRLENLQDAVAAVDESLYLDTITGVVNTAFEAFVSQQGRVDWRDLDLALHEVFIFGHFAQKSGGLYNKHKPITPAAERLIGMMLKLVESDIGSFPHPAVQLQYMEICVRYSTFFEANPVFIPQALNHFVRFVHHEHVKVKTRSWYLFFRFTKLLRQHISSVAQTIIQSLGDLLVIKAELPRENPDQEDDSTIGSDQQEDAKFNSQLHLYEAIGCVCSAHGVPIEDQVLYVRSIVNPIFSDLEIQFGPAKGGDEKAILQVHHTILALGTLAHGFVESTSSSNSSANPPPKEVSEEFTRVAEAILLALESLNSHVQTRDAARAAFARLFGVLGNRILPQLPRWFDGLLVQKSSKDEIASFLRLLGQVVFGFKTEIYSILNSLLSPLLQRVFTGIAEPTNGTDDEIQLVELKTHYLAFLQVILSNNLARVLVSGENQPMFETIISSIEHFTKDVDDFLTAKIAFQVATKMCATWGGPDVAPPAANGQSNAQAETALPGFDRFMMERFSGLAWTFPSNAAFNPRDAQGRQVLSEAAGLQKAIYTKAGQTYLSYLRVVELRGMGMDDATIDSYLNALMVLDLKGFKQFFLKLVQDTKR